MTIVACLKVSDGVVLGADSAGTLLGGNAVQNVYFNQEKIANLRKGLPIGIATYGLGGLAGRSLTSLAKDLRKRFSAPGDWHLDPENYTMEDVAKRVREFFYKELYVPEHGHAPSGEAPPLGFVVAGYSAEARKPEVWTVEIDNDGACPGPQLVYREDNAGTMLWRGQPEALNRLFLGVATESYQRLLAGGLTEPDAQNVLQSPAPLAHPAMPIQDAIDLVKFACDTTCGFIRFQTGAPIVAPPIDIAAVTLHERFKWVQRKHYFPGELNPPPEWDPARQWPSE